MSCLCILIPLSSLLARTSSRWRRLPTAETWRSSEFQFPKMTQDYHVQSVQFRISRRTLRTITSPAAASMPDSSPSPSCAPGRALLARCDAPGQVPEPLQGVSDGAEDPGARRSDACSAPHRTLGQARQYHQWLDESCVSVSRGAGAVWPLKHQSPAQLSTLTSFTFLFTSPLFPGS